MALIRAELQGSPSVSRVYDGVVETAADLSALAGSGTLPGAPERGFGPGSLLYCLADGKLYVKKENLTWAEVTV